MKTEYDRTTDDNGKREHDAQFGVDEAPMTVDTDAGADTAESPRHDVPMRPGPDLIMDERLTSAAAPFLYMLSLVLIAVAGYFIYLFFHG